MKVRVYGAKEEEIAYSESLRLGYPLELTYAKEVLGPDTVELTRGYDAVWIVTACKNYGSGGEKLTGKWCEIRGDPFRRV